MTRRCAATRSDGQPCRNPPLAGATVCKYHGGNAPQVRARAAVRAEVMRWGLDDRDTHTDPGEVLWRLLDQSADRCELYAELLEQAYAAETDHGPDGSIALPGGVRALIGHKYAIDGGERFPVEEAIRGLVQLEAQERDRCGNFAKIAIAANLAERGLQLDQQRVDLVAAALKAALADAGLDAQAPEVLAGVGRHLRAIAR